MLMPGRKMSMLQKMPRHGAGGLGGGGGQREDSVSVNWKVGAMAVWCSPHGPARTK